MPFNQNFPQYVSACIAAYPPQPQFRVGPAKSVGMKLEAPPPRIIADPKLLEEQVPQGLPNPDANPGPDPDCNPNANPGTAETSGSVQQDKAIYARQ